MCIFSGKPYFMAADAFRGFILVKTEKIKVAVTIMKTFSGGMAVTKVSPIGVTQAGKISLLNRPPA